MFRQKLRMLRLQHEVSQTELARRLGLASHTNISHLEAQRHTPSLGLVLQVAGIFGVSADYLLRDAQSPQPAAPASSAPRNDLALAHLGEQLRRLRHQAGLTQVQLAQQLGLAAHTHISYLERGLKTPSPDLAVQLADVFGVPVDRLFQAP
jgi:transcriptional regulator with XRE-family HTH domain